MKYQTFYSSLGQSIGCIRVSYIRYLLWACILDRGLLRNCFAKWRVRGTPMARESSQCVRKRHVHVHGYVYSLPLEELSVCNSIYMCMQQPPWYISAPRSTSWRQRSVSGADARSRVSLVDFFCTGRGSCEAERSSKPLGTFDHCRIKLTLIQFAGINKNKTFSLLQIIYI